MAMTRDQLAETGITSRKVLLVYTGYSTFVQADHEMLASFSQVTPYNFRPVKGPLATIRELVRQLFFLFSRWKQYDLIFIWFADTHAFLPVWYGRMRKIKTAVVIGGFDAVSIPEIKYGLYCSNRVRQFLGRFSVRNATVLLPVDGSLVENTNYFADKKGKGLPVGINYFVPGIRGKVLVLPTGYDADFWKPVEGIRRKNSVVTVGSIIHWQRWYLKGCDFFTQIAVQIPDMDFHIYGAGDTLLAELKKTKLPHNLHLHGFVLTKELPAIYSSHQIYAQLSLSEGLPNVLCEAMLCGCIPVGSDVNGIPGVIGDKELIVDEFNIPKAVTAIYHAKMLAENNNKQFRNRIVEKFPLTNRKVNLSLLIQS